MNRAAQFYYIILLQNVWIHICLCMSYMQNGKIDNWFIALRSLKYPTDILPYLIYFCLYLLTISECETSFVVFVT